MTTRRVASTLCTTLAAAAVALVAADAEAQIPSLDLRGFNPPTDPAGGFAWEPASAPDTFDWNAALFTSYAWRSVTLRDPETDEVANSIIEHQLSGDVVFNIGFFERLAVGVDLPFVLYQGGDDPDARTIDIVGEHTLPAQALGDLKIALKGTLIPPTSGEFGGFALALHERFSVPTGNEESFLGEGHVASETRVLLEYRFVALSAHGAIGVKLRAEEGSYGCAAIERRQADGEDVSCPTTFQHELPWTLALVFRPQAVGLDDGGHWTWFVESYGYLPVSPEAPFTNAAVSQAQLGVGARYEFDNDMSIMAGIDAALLGGIGTAPVRATLSVAWAPRTHDQDDDGVRDDQDLCPEDLKEDRDGHQDDDGCPDWDNDDDGVPDQNDKCDGEAEDEDGHQDDDGCADPDNDGDNILDIDDACPDKPGIQSEDPKQRGCPDNDPDKDGVLGAADKCPAEPEDVDQHDDGDGCIDADNDGDKILDADDACRDVPGKPFPDNKDIHGCPDADDDGVIDSKDACPEVKGVATEDAATNGCEPPPPPEPEKPKPRRRR
jgi:OmpA-OmpF porin, OOP family